MSSGVPPIPTNINIVDITAPQIFGAVFNWCLYGMLSVQIYIYYLNFPEDRPFVKRLVYGTYIIETAQVTFSTADIYYWFSPGFGNVSRLAEVHISPWDTPLLCGIIALIVQCFFAHRIWRLQRSFWISVLIILTSLIQTIGAVGIAIQAHFLGTFDRVSKVPMFPTMWLLGDTVCDILIAGSMLYIFYKFKKEDFRHTNRILARLARLVLETNALTASMALLSFILFIGFPNNNYFTCPTLVMGKLYSNTLLITFNNRIAIRKLALPGGSWFGTLQWARGSNISNRAPETTYHFSIDRSQNGVRSHTSQNIEMEILKPEKVFGRQDDSFSITVCQHPTDCHGCT